MLVGRNNSKHYIEAFLPLVKEDMAAAGIYNPIFMQDNSSTHNSYATQGWLDDEGWQIADHPACSPDLNPIEYAWRFLKKILHERFPDLASCTDGPVAVKKRVAECLREAWKEVPSSLLDSLTRLMLCCCCN